MRLVARALREYRAAASAEGGKGKAWAPAELIAASCDPADHPWRAPAPGAVMVGDRARHEATLDADAKGTLLEQLTRSADALVEELGDGIRASVAWGIAPPIISLDDELKKREPQRMPRR